MLNSYNYGENGASRQTAPDDKGSVGFAILSFFIPIVGLILFLVWRKEKPKKAKSAGIGAIIGFVLGIISYAVILPQLLAQLAGGAI
jgi:uncharacterized protein YqgC (DUF456 family)